MDFKTYFFGLPRDEQEALAIRAGSSHQMLAQIARGNKDVELGFADAIVAVCGGHIALDDLPLTARARMQRDIRSGVANQVREEAAP